MAPHSSPTWFTELCNDLLLDGESIRRRMREVSFSYNVITAWNAPAKSSRRSIIHLALINYVGASSPATLPYSSFSTTFYPFHYPSSSPSIAEAAFQWQSCNQLRLTTRTTFYAHPWPDWRPITRDETHTVLYSRPHSAAFLPCPVSSCALRCTLVSRAASVYYDGGNRNAHPYSWPWLSLEKSGRLLEGGLLK